MSNNKSRNDKRGMGKRKSLLSGASIVAAAAMLAGSPAMAQQPEEEVEEEEAIVVTGSRIARPALDSGVPVLTVTAEELQEQGDLSLGDALNDLPAIRGTFSQSNSTRFIGTAGLNILDLRGLGTARTLTLVNGRRHVTGLPGDYLVDVNTIPSELLERVDVVTGGSSAVYGSDAIAGVVNFVTRTDYEGIRFNVQYGSTPRGDRTQYFGAVTAGQNFADDRGNIAISAEYSNADSYFRTDRPDLSGAGIGRNQFNLSENTADDGPTGSDGIPDNLFWNRVRNNNIAEGGLLTALGCNAGTFNNPALCTVGSTSTSFLGAAYVFTPNGNLVLNPIERDFRFLGSGNAIGGLGSTLSDYGDLAPGVERVSINVLAHYDITEWATVFGEAKWVELQVDQTSSPSFWQGAFTGFFGVAGYDLRCDNPFLNAQAYAQLQNIGRCNSAIAYGSPNAQTFAISRNNLDWGVRSERNTRETTRFVLGLRGEFNDDWNYEISANRGQFDATVRSINDLALFDLVRDIDGEVIGFDVGPFFRAIDARRDGGGNIVCGINADADPLNDDPACQPLNPFGVGNSSQAAIDYIMRTSLSGSEATQTVYSGFVAGDSSQLFSLPGGPVRFVVGAEQRTEEAAEFVDDETRFGANFLTALQPVNYPEVETEEYFAEIALPILEGMPFADLLEFTAAGRRSEYNTAVGEVDAYNYTGVYRPVPDILFRAAFGVAVRAPTQSDLFSPLGQNFAFIQDPCDVLFINNGPNRAARCAEAGVPVGFENTPARSATLSFEQGGNNTLFEETSKSRTYGIVLQPRWIPGLTATIDYYDIEVENLIATLGAQTIINLCYDDPGSLANQYCAIVYRDPVTDFFEDPAVTAGPVNFARQETQGYDAAVYYTHSFENGDRLTGRLIASYTTLKNNFTNPTNPNFADRQLSELGDPEWEWGLGLSWERGPWTLQGEARYIGRMTIGAYEAQNSFDGRPPTNPDQFPVVWYDPVVYFDIRADYDLNDIVTAYAGIDNLTDEYPPFGLVSTGAGSGIYDDVGRYLYAGVRLRY